MIDRAKATGRGAGWTVALGLALAGLAGPATAEPGVPFAVAPTIVASLDVDAREGAPRATLPASTPRRMPLRETGTLDVQGLADAYAAALAASEDDDGATTRARLIPASMPAAKRGRLERRWRYGRNEYSAIIERYAAENDVPAEFAHAIVEIESRFRPNVRGRHGEIGLMQIKPATARLVGFRGPARALYDPDTNIKFGMRYLAKARRLGGETLCGTILKYNAGHGARRMNRVSRAYCEKVKGVLARNAERYELETITSYAFLDAPRPRFRATRVAAD